MNVTVMHEIVFNLIFYLHKIKWKIKVKHNLYEVKFFVCLSDLLEAQLAEVQTTEEGTAVVVNGLVPFKGPEINVLPTNSWCYD